MALDLRDDRIFSEEKGQEDMADTHGADSNMLWWVAMAVMGIWNSLLSLAIGRGVPWAVGLHTTVAKHEDRIANVEKATVVIPEINNKLSIIADRMPKRSADNEHRGD